ncbi:MAG TPA: CheR family methyltransferase [Geomonas sp.]|nr:CheR family methyltransferase [Geomonas sp.]
MDHGALAITEESPQPAEASSGSIPAVVGIGASAGGLEPLERFFRQLPPDTGMAFVVVQHMEPGPDLLLPVLLQRSTRMEVCQATDRTALQRDRVYVVPPGCYPSLLKGVLHLFAPSNAIPQRHPIDFFFRSLSGDLGERAIAVIMSGAGQDGTAGARTVKEHAGLVLVQEPASAHFRGMPASAIDAGLADLVGKPEELAARLAACGGRFALRGCMPLGARKEERAPLDKIVILLRDRTGHDFAPYKPNTLFRRLERRMAIQLVDSLDTYLRFLQANPQELDLLCRELLIGVTSFFRDPHEWDILERVVIPALLADRKPGSVLRVWTAGCSTGEEAYSLAIALHEAVSRRGAEQACRIQILATDADARAIEHARRGLFPAAIEEQLSTERLNRYFVQQGGCYQICTEIRELITFAGQNILTDPPFIKLDLLVCRNLLVYLESDFQKRMLPLFHYALKPDAYLFLGQAESVGAVSDLFAAVAGNSRIYRRQHAPCREPIAAPPAGLPARKGAADAEQPVSDLQRMADQLLLLHHSPPALLVRQTGDIVYINGMVGKYLQLSSGKVNLNLFAMAGEELGAVLPGAFARALQQDRPVTIKGIALPGRERRLLDVTLELLTKAEPLRGLVLILFRELTPPPRKSRGKDVRVAELQCELEDLREEMRNYRLEMQDTREDLGATNDELQATNEELQSTVEELQSSIEDLCTTKEELQSAKEATDRLNIRKRERIEQLQASLEEAEHFLDSTGIATIFLDQALCVQRFTPQAGGVFRLLPQDVGRPLSDLACGLDWSSLPEEAGRVLETGVPLERGVSCCRDRRRYLAMIAPFRRGAARIEGVVLTFCDVTSLVA